MSSTIRRRKGFTLIELMIVVAIIGILAAIAIPNFLRFQLKAKSSEGKTNLAAIRTAEESYFAEYGAYVSADPSPAAVDDNQKTDFSDAVAKSPPKLPTDRAPAKTKQLSLQLMSIPPRCLRLLADGSRGEQSSAASETQPSIFAGFQLVLSLVHAGRNFFVFYCIFY